MSPEDSRRIYESKQAENANTNTDEVSDSQSPDENEPMNKTDISVKDDEIDVNQAQKSDNNTNNIRSMLAMGGFLVLFICGVFLASHYYRSSKAKSKKR